MDLYFNCFSFFLGIILCFCLCHGQKIDTSGASADESTVESASALKIFKEFSISGQSLLNVTTANTSLPIDLVITSTTLEVNLSINAKPQAMQECKAVLIPRLTEEEEQKQKYLKVQIPFDIFLFKCDALSCSKRSFLRFLKNRFGGIEDLSAFNNTLMTLYITCNETDRKISISQKELISVPLNIKVPMPLPLLEMKDADIEKDWKSVHHEDIRILLLPFKIKETVSDEYVSFSLKIARENDDGTFDLAPFSYKQGLHLVEEEVKEAEKIRKRTSLRSEPSIFESFNLWNNRFTPSSQGDALEAIVKKNMETGKLVLRKDIKGIPHCEVTLAYDLELDSNTKITKVLSIFRCTGVNCGMEVHFHLFKDYLSSLNRLVSTNPTASLLNIQCYIKEDRKYINTDSLSYKLNLKITTPISFKESSELAILKTNVGPIELEKVVLDYIPFEIPEFAFPESCFFYSRQVSFIENISCPTTVILTGRCLHRDAYAEPLQIGAEFILQDENQEVLIVEELENKLKLKDEECGDQIDEHGYGEEDEIKTDISTEENDIEESFNPNPECQRIDCTFNLDLPCTETDKTENCFEQKTPPIFSTDVLSNGFTKSDASYSTSVTALASFSSLLIICVYIL